MKIIDIVNSLLPDGTNGSEFWEDAASYRPVHIDVLRCPIWPPDIFAVIGTLIERSPTKYAEAWDGPTGRRRTSLPR